MPEHTVTFSAGAPINWSTPDGGLITHVQVEPETNFCVWSPGNPLAIALCPLGAARYEEVAGVHGVLPVPGDSATYYHDWDEENYSDNSGTIVLTFTYGPTVPTFPELDAPVTVHLSEELNGVFADPTIDVSYFQPVDLPVGVQHAIGDQLSGATWYSYSIRDRSKSRGIISYQGDTLLAALGRVTPTATLILVAGQGGVPNPLDIRECLRRFLAYYGVPFVDDLPVFALRVGDELVAPQVDAFVIQPDPENPESIYSHLAKFFGPFRGYRFRENVFGQLEVAPPAWVDTIGLRLTVYRRRQDGDRTPVRYLAVAPWSTTRAPLVSWEGVVDGTLVSGNLGPLEQSDSTYETVTIGPFSVRVYWLTSLEVRLWVNPAPSDDVAVGSLFTASFTFRPAGSGGVEQVVLTNDDLGPDEIETISADSVINQAVLNVRRRSFEADQALMQAAALVLRSPEQLMAGAFGSNPPFGPMAWDPDDPVGFLTLANAQTQNGTWFWPVDPGVVIQPGGTISVQYEVEEWAEQWSTPGTTPHAAAFKANEYGDSATLPASGEEVKLFDLQFPRESTNVVMGAYGAEGSVYARWRAGDQPGIELRVGNARFVEFGYVPELGPFGSSYYFLWGFILTLNGTGTTFTVGDLETYRFGFSRALDGLWEGGADVPGLAQSQALYPNRVYVADELPYEVTAETALAIARGIVEENLTPKIVYQLPIAPSRADGYAAKPWHIGRAASVPALGIAGRITGFGYTETNTSAGTSSDVTIDVEVAQAAAGTPASPEGRRYARAIYRVTTYQKEE